MAARLAGPDPSGEANGATITHRPFTSRTGAPPPDARVEEPEGCFQVFAGTTSGSFEEPGCSSLINCRAFRFKPFQESADAQGAEQQRAQTN